MELIVCSSLCSILQCLERSFKMLMFVFMLSGYVFAVHASMSFAHAHFDGGRCARVRPPAGKEYANFTCA